MKSQRFSKIAKRLNLKLSGNDIAVSGINEPERARAGELVFIINKRILRNKAAIQSKAWIIDEALWSPVLKSFLDSSLISYGLSKNVYEDLAAVIDLFYPSAKPSGRIHKTARIHKSVRLKNNVSVGAYCLIDSHSVLAKNVQLMPHSIIGNNVRIGANTTIGSHVVIYDNCEIGSNVLIHSGTVIGSSGFGFYKKEDRFRRIPHVGKVVIEDNVEIGANCCIDRGTLGETRIKKGAKLDNLIQVAHNVVIGENTLMAAQTGIAGSTVIGKNVTIAGQVGIVGHVAIGDGVTIGAQSGVIASIEEGKTVSGYPARDHMESLKKEIYIRRIPEILKDLADKKKEK
jgi:UDP-3-O-[3-hydroxymyristoyl] glucosamine N-acyltransferase